MKNSVELIFVYNADETPAVCVDADTLSQCHTIDDLATVVRRHCLGDERS